MKLIELYEIRPIKIRHKNIIINKNKFILE